MDDRAHPFLAEYDTIGVFMTLAPDQARILLPFREMMASGAQPLRVGVVLDGMRASRWVESLITLLRELPGIQVCPLTFGDQRPTEAKGPSWLMDRLYSASRRRFDPFSEADRALGETEPVKTDTLDSIGTLGCGVVIWMASCHDPRFNLEAWQNMAS